MERRGTGAKELRAVTKDGRRLVVGLAVPYGSESSDLGGFVEVFERGAMADSVREANAGTRKVHAFWNHDSAAVLGSTKGGKLKLRETARGVEFELDASRLTPAQLDAVQDGDLGVSFGFRGAVDTWVERPGGTLRRVRQAELLEVSLVAMPAYKATEADLTVAYRSLNKAKTMGHAKHRAQLARHELDMKTDKRRTYRDGLRLLRRMERIDAEARELARKIEGPGDAAYRALNPDWHWEVIERAAR